MGREKDMEEKRHRIIGTAGHIDHGKTWLVKALTGTDLSLIHISEPTRH